jgi:hypothetical protein
MFFCLRLTSPALSPVVHGVSVVNGGRDVKIGAISFDLTNSLKAYGTEWSPALFISHERILERSQ